MQSGTAQVTGSAPATESRKSRSQRLQKGLAVVGWVGLLMVYVGYSRANNLGPVQAVQELVVLMQQSMWGPLIYVVLYALRPLVFFSATLLTLAGGFLFGPVWGIVYTVAASNLSALVAYGIGRYLGTGFLDVDKLGGLIGRYADRMRRRSFETVLIMRFIFLPYDWVSYVAGLLRVNGPAFFWATFAGCLPGTVSFVLAGASLEGGFDGGLPRLNPWALAASVLIFVVSLWLARVFKQREAVQGVAPDAGSEMQG